MLCFAVVCVLLFCFACDVCCAFLIVRRAVFYDMLCLVSFGRAMFSYFCVVTRCVFELCSYLSSRRVCGTLLWLRGGSDNRSQKLPITTRGAAAAVELPINPPSLIYLTSSAQKTMNQIQNEFGNHITLIVCNTSQNIYDIVKYLLLQFVVAKYSI